MTDEVQCALCNRRNATQKFHTARICIHCFNCIIELARLTDHTSNDQTRRLLERARTKVGEDTEDGETSLAVVQYARQFW